MLEHFHLFCSPPPLYQVEWMQKSLIYVYKIDAQNVTWNSIKYSNL